MNRTFRPPLKLGAFVPPGKKAEGAAPAAPALPKPCPAPRPSLPIPKLEKDDAMDLEEDKKEEEKEQVQETSPVKSEPAPVRTLGMSRTFKSPLSLLALPGGPKPSPTPSAAAKRPGEPLDSPEAKKPRLEVKEEKKEEKKEEGKLAGEVAYWTCLWCKFSKKKHKSYGDGILVARISLGSCELLDMANKSLGKSNNYSKKVLEGLVTEAELLVAGKEVILQSPIKPEEFASGRAFLAPEPVAPPTSMAIKLAKSNLIQSRTGTDKPAIQLHDPDRPDAFVLWRPAPKAQGFAVVVDPRIDRSLRPHQREGVRFMFECVSGLFPARGQGCILADEMGLGKTLQTLTLLWTLLKQGADGRETVQRAIIVSPSSLVKNWGKEIKKWFGSERLAPLLIGDDSKAGTREKLETFKNGGSSRVLVISYESCRVHADLLAQTKAGLLICDEGHRLRNPASKTTLALANIPTLRRVVLSGTPFQNNLDEFYALVDFCNPGVLGAPELFRNAFARPIELSRDRGCKPEQRVEGEARAQELFSITRKFILRRTSEVLERYLPPRTDQVLLCLPTELQKTLYKSYLSSDEVMSAYKSGSVTSALACIIILKKLCNHPQLLLVSKDAAPKEKPKKSANADNDESDEEVEYQAPAINSRVLSKMPPEMKGDSVPNPSYSGKMDVLLKLLAEIRKTKDNVVLVSFYRQTLDLLQRLCEHNSYPFLRLDGNTPPKTRQDLVDRFNDPASPYFVFLLSTKAGGEGLNLIGGNRLVLFDCDWNPAYERQAMARIWRDGQRKEVWIYRLITTGTIEEKIFQRQLVKQSMSQKVMHAEMTEADFSDEDLRDIFCLTDNTRSETVDLLLNKGGGQAKKKKSGADLMGALKGWNHFEDPKQSKDELSRKLETDRISYVFTHSTVPEALTAPKLDTLKEEEEEKEAAKEKEEESEESEEKEASGDGEIEVEAEAEKAVSSKEEEKETKDKAVSEKKSRAELVPDVGEAWMFEL